MAIHVTEPIVNKEMKLSVCLSTCYIHSWPDQENTCLEIGMVWRRLADQKKIYLNLNLSSDKMRIDKVHIDR